MAPLFHFHDTLNPELWQHNQLKPLVRLKLFQAAVSFYKFLDVDRLIVSDIIFTGSNAAYNYTKLSDIDVHLIVDIHHSSCPTISDNLFRTKKALWGQTYNAKVFDIPIELYVENIENPVKANGIFSILHNHWLHKPSPVRPHTNDSSVRNKRDAYAGVIDDLLAGDPDVREIDILLNRLRSMRSSGLLHGGEYGVENLTFKALRDAGLIQQLHDKKIKLRNAELSLI